MFLDPSNALSLSVIGRSPPQSSLRPASQPFPGSQIIQDLRRHKLHRNPKVLGIGFLWLLGLFAVFLAPAPVSLTEERLNKYEKRLKILEATEAPRQAAEQRWLQAEQEIRRSQEWFWRFKPAVRKRVNDKKAKSAEVRKEFAALKKEAEQKFSDAKAELGLWSDAGLAEGRSLFWSAFDKGKVFGRRQTFWDALITILTSREEGLIGMVIQLVFQAMINFTTGMVASVFIFIFNLPSLLWSYQPNFISGLAFFLIATIGALSVISGFLLALYGAGATAVYSLATIAPNRRIGSGRAPWQRPGHLRYRRFHVD